MAVGQCHRWQAGALRSAVVPWDMTPYFHLSGNGEAGTHGPLAKEQIYSPEGVVTGRGAVPLHVAGEQDHLQGACKATWTPLD